MKRRRKTCEVQGGKSFLIGESTVQAAVHHGSWENLKKKKKSCQKTTNLEKRERKSGLWRTGKSKEDET